MLLFHLLRFNGSTNREERETHRIRSGSINRKKVNMKWKDKEKAKTKKKRKHTKQTALEKRMKSERKNEEKESK